MILCKTRADTIPTMKLICIGEVVEQFILITQVFGPSRVRIEINFKPILKASVVIKASYVSEDKREIKSIKIKIEEYK